MMAAPATETPAPRQRDGRRDKNRNSTRESTRPRVDVATLALLLGEGVHELRAPKAGKFRTVSGYFSDPTALAAAAESWSGRAPGIYVSINPTVPALLARCANRAQAHAETTTSDRDIERRTRLYIDCDPVRPSGIASTDAEHQAALNRVQAIARDLTALGWPTPIVVDSGNGSALFFAIDLPNDAEATALVTGVLKALDASYSDDVVKIDTTVSNAARIARIPGTLNSKGDDTPERPHRYCRVIDAPEALDVVPRELLAALAGEAAEPDREQAQASNGAVFDIDGFIGRHGLEIRRDEAWDGKRRIQLERCPFNAEHIEGSAALFVMASGAIAFRCHHDGCAGRKWADVRELFEPDRRHRSNGDARDDHHADVGVDDGIAETPEARWPDPIGEDALQGLAGEFVRLIEPHTEASREALLFQFLAAAGSMLGRHRYYEVEGDRHYAVLYVVLVGLSAKGRKGTSWSRVLRVAKVADETWQRASGLSSGEGLIWSVRDPVRKIVKGEETIEDPGIADKRLLIQESEFASTLRVLAREGNTLSAVMRNAWDSGSLRSLTKNSPARATDAHISVIGHIVGDEARRYLDRTEMGNGFGNRILWVCSKRSKRLPLGGAAESLDLAPIIKGLEASVAFAASVAPVPFDSQARELWCALYDDLSRDRYGLLGALTSRAEAQTVRLALIYSILDRSPVIREDHLRAALACWRYAEASAGSVFGEALGDPLADRLLALLRDAGPAGMTRTAIRDATNRHNPPAVARALGTLETAGLARRWAEPTPGRPAERWAAIFREPPCDQSDQSDQSPPDSSWTDPSVASVASVAPSPSAETEEPPPPDDSFAPEEPTDGWGGEALV